jgi:uncharacterized protein YciI
MKYVLLYEGAEGARARVPLLIDAHRALWKEFRSAGQLLMVGPFVDPSGGAMGVFTSRDAAERFVAADPFVSEGLVSRWTIREWHEVLMPE